MSDDIFEKDNAENEESKHNEIDDSQNELNTESGGGNSGEEDNEALDGDILPRESSAESQLPHLGDMYQTWFLDYASYVILERAVPHINDGFKPVQRRILHAMRRMDDGRYNKVANIIGFTMQFHPHGDASIGDALVQLGQKNLLIDTQGNWGNVATGDGAAAARYIEARLTPFAKEVVFNPKTTNWKASYDGRNKEPVTLPVKFPLLLAQGVEGIAVGLNSKIMPHNFNELIDACILYLEDKPFQIYPDFTTGGQVDVSKYNDGQRGGSVKVRAKITKFDSRTLMISDLPYGRTTSSLIDSIIRANDKGKIKIKKIDDNTAQDVEILVHLPSGVSTDKTIDALYAFSDCEMSISPNCCIIEDNKPHFIGVSDVLRHNTNNTVNLLKLELEIRMGELGEAWHMSSLERIFIENKIYQRIEECETMEAIISEIDLGLEPFKKSLRREVTTDDIIKLTEIKIKRISRFDAFKSEEYIKSLEEEMTEVAYNLENIIAYSITYFKHIKKTYGKPHTRKTEIRSFESIEASKVVVKNEKLYINRAEGFIGTGLKKDEYICECSDIDDIIVIYKDGRYVITKVSDKAFVGKGILHAAVFKKGDKRTIYNIIYRDGKSAVYYVKRCAITGVTRDKEYDLTKGTDDSEITYLSVNPNGESEVLKIILKPKTRIRNVMFDYDMGKLAIKGRGAQGNILTKYQIKSVSLRRKGESTLGGRKIWFDKDVLRLNADSRGDFLGEFNSSDQILVVTKAGKYFTTNYDLSNHYPEDLLLIQKFNPEKIWSLAFFDADKKFFYLKRFQFEESSKVQSIIGDNEKSHMLVLSDKEYARFEVIFGGGDKHRETLTVDADEFIAVKGYKARGKRLSTFEISKINELEPTRFPEEDENAEDELKDSDDQDNADE